MSEQRILHIDGLTGFDPARHARALVARVEQDKGERGWRFHSYEPETGRATLVHRPHVDTVEHTGADRKLVRLDPSTRSSEIPRKAAGFESIYPGYHVTGIDVDTGVATLSRLDETTVRARDALAVALSVRPWDIGICPVDGGGYDIAVPVSYVPSKHDARLAEAVETAIGEPGWWISIDSKTNRGRIRPGEISSFPKVVPYPVPPGRALTVAEQMRLPLGVTLACGPSASRPLFLDLADSAGVLIQGTPGSGKSVTVNALIVGAIERGWHIGIGDVPYKEVDFTWCKPYVHDGWYGAASKKATLAVAEDVYNLRNERKRLLERHRVTKWNDLPDQARPAPVLLVIDELQGLYVLEPVPKKIPEGHPDYDELVGGPTARNIRTEKLKLMVRRIAAELRFVGVRLLLATQQAQGNTGIDQSLKMLFPNRILLGARTNEAARRHAFSDPKSAVTVPESVASDSAMAKGVGVAEVEGEGSTVFKSYFATPGDYARRLAEQGRPMTSRPEPELAAEAGR